VVKLHFESPQEFETLFSNNNIKVTNAIVKSIQEAMTSRKNTALLFEITFEEHDNLYEISLPQSQWSTALQSCLDHYHRLDMADQAIDTWKLLEAAKVW
jgi:hypothetical protein